MWEQREQSLIASGVTPETADWQPRLKHWLFGRGATLSNDGSLQCRNPRQQQIAQKIGEAHDLSSQRSFNPDREKDELTLALGNKEHPGCTQGVGLVNWKVGFPQDVDNYKSRKRKQAEKDETL